MPNKKSPSKKPSRPRKSGKKGGKGISLLIYSVAILGLVFLGFRYRDIWLKPLTSPKPDITEAEPVLPPFDKQISDALKKTADKLGANPENLVIREDVASREYRVLFPVQTDDSDFFPSSVIQGEMEAVGAKRIGDKHNFRELLFENPRDFLKYRIRLKFMQKQPSTEYPPEKVSIAIVIDDFGDITGSLLDDFGSQTDPSVTFAVMPHRPYTAKSVEVARKHGHEFIVHMPMEPESYPKNDPGKGAILVSQSEAEIARNLSNAVGQIPGAIGMNNHMGSRATASEKTMKAVMRFLKKQDLFFLDSYTQNNSVAMEVATTLGVKTTKRDIFLDAPDLSFKSFNDNVDKVNELKDEGQRFIVVITHCHTREKLDHLNRFVTRLENLRYGLVPLSKVIEKTNGVTIF